jgi:hypothetical protein
MSGRLRAGIAVGLVTVAGASATMALGAKSSQVNEPRVPISAREFSFTGQKTLRSGPTTFALTNKGEFPHNFVVVAGPTRFAVPVTQPGQTGYATANLAPGAYLAICTIRNGGHMRDGMVRVFTAGTQDQATGEWRP